METEKEKPDGEKLVALSILLPSLLLATVWSSAFRLWKKRGTGFPTR
jgi:hypothetical protein